MTTGPAAPVLGFTACWEQVPERPRGPVKSRRLPMTRTCTIALLAALAAPAAAAAQTPPAPSPPGQQPPPQQQPPQQQPQPQPAPAPAPAPAPQPAKLTIAAGRSGAALARTRLRIAGRLTPAAPGEKVVVRIYRGRRKLVSKSVTVGKDGAFRLGLKMGRSGSIVLRASHRQTPAVGTAVSRAVRLDVLPRSVPPGARGTAVRLLQRHLAKRGYVVGRRGTYDGRTARAVLAFRKVSGMSRTSSADRGVMRRLARGGGRFKVRHPDHGKHIEADLSRQVIALIRGRKVERIYPTSSGSPATPTVRGHFKFYMSQAGYNAKEMYFSKYFIRGYAIHGYKSVPVYPASHGCLRVPIPDAVAIYNWIRIGDRIDVYG